MLSGKPELLKKINTGSIVDMVRRDGPLSRAELAKRLHMSRPTVSKLVSELLAEQVLVEIGVGPSSGGKKPIYLQINSKGAYVIGVHVAYPTIRIALANNLGDVLKRGAIPAPDSLDSLLDEIVSQAHELLGTAKLTANDLSAVGVAFSGIVNPQQGDILYARFFPFVKGTTFKEQLEQRLRAPVFIDNDVYMGVLGEASVLDRQPYSLAFVTLGAMIGMGMMIEGQVFRGARFAAGEIGDMLIDAPRQLSGGYHPEGGYLERWLGALGNEGVLRAAQAGSEAALALVREDQTKLAVMLANIVSLFDPERLIIGGTILQVQDLFLPQIRTLLKDLTGRAIELETAHYSEDSELIGGIAKAIQSLQQKISIKQHGI
ncbi:ROK family protein [Paenibacillus sp. HJGM_3]|uniref:ROK family transcriptional regulator n=1 Tax=Paenibacillus sp. HJGM_3 TaxID=3379816 RepID=UPI00385C95A2